MGAGRCRAIGMGAIRLAVCGLLLLASGGRAQPANERKSFDRDGPFKVKTLEFRALKDAKRDDRPVPIKVHYPDAAGPFPLVIISHGGAGNWDSNVTQAARLASHGYVVLCPEHVYSNTATVRGYMRAGGGRGRRRLMEALQRITTDPKAVLERPRDISFAIDTALKWNASESPLKGRIISEKIAVMGHSYGAYTTLVVCGARPILDYLDPPVAPGKGPAPDLSDPRVTVGLVMSPQGPGCTFFNEQSYKTINRPLFCLSGSRDLAKSATGTLLPPSNRKKAFDLLPPGNKTLLWLENADHLAFSYNPAARIQLPSPARKDAQRISKAVMVLVCDAWLKNSAEARAALNKETISALCGDVVSKVDWFEK